MLIFLGIEGAGTAPAAREVATAPWKWQHRSACTKRELLSLIGQRMHAKLADHSSDAWWTTPANQRIQVRPAVVGTLPPGRGRIEGIFPTQYTGSLHLRRQGHGCVWRF